MSDHIDMIPERRQGLVWNKSISLGNVLTIIMMAAAMFIWGGKMEGRISIIESSDIARKEAAAIQLAAENARAAETRQDFREIRQMIEALRNTVSKKN